MRYFKNTFYALVLIFNFFTYALFALELSPTKDLTLEEALRVAGGERVIINELALKNINNSFEVIINAAISGKPVYGLNVGVGWNKDKEVFIFKDNKRLINNELLQRSREFNISSLRAHGAGLGESFSSEAVRLSMLLRLNSAVRGYSGISPELATAYLNFLNYKISPIVPSGGSVGEADIALASHIGLAMMGEWMVEFKGQQMPAKRALDLENLPTLNPVAKDFLSIISTNSLVSADLIISLKDAEQILLNQIKIYALMLEGLNGNIAPFSHALSAKNNFKGIQNTAIKINECLKGSYLLKRKIELSKIHYHLERKFMPSMKP